jgi:hypothetical protein
MSTSRRTSRTVVAKTEATCAGCAGLLEELLQLRKMFEKNDSRIAELERRAEPIDLDGDPRPPGNWVSVKAATASGYSESGIHAKIRRGELRSWKRGGRVEVDVAGLVPKKQKNSVRTFGSGCMRDELEKSKDRA